MFPVRVFPGRIFPSRIFPHAATIAPPPSGGGTPRTVLAAVRALALADATLAATIGPHWYNREAAQGTAETYITAHVQASTPIRSSETTKTRDEKLRIKVYAPQLTTTGDIADRINNILEGTALDIVGGFVAPLYQTNWVETRETKRGPTSKELWATTIEYSARTVRYR